MQISVAASRRRRLGRRIGLCLGLSLLLGVMLLLWFGIEAYKSRSRVEDFVISPTLTSFGVDVRTDASYLPYREARSCRSGGGAVGFGESNSASVL